MVAWFLLLMSNTETILAVTSTKGFHHSLGTEETRSLNTTTTAVSIHETPFSAVTDFPENTSGLTLLDIEAIDEGPNVSTNDPKSNKPNPYAIIHEGVVSKDQYEKCSLVINIILKPVVCTAGVVMNTIGACVLFHQSFKRSTYTYLRFLAISDAFILLSGIVLLIPKIINLHDDVMANFIEVHMFPYISIFAGSVFTRISEYVICALSIERFVAVLRPLKVRELFLSRHALGISIGVVTFCFLYHAHYLIIYYPKAYFNPSRNTTMYALGKQSWYANSGIEAVYTNVYYFIFLYIPPIVLIVCNIGILVKVYEANKKRQDLFAKDGMSKQMGQEQRRMTLILLIISMSFLAVFVPLSILTIIQQFDKQIRIFGREHYLLSVMIDVLSLGWNVSSANDFIVYSYSSKQFRNTLLAMFFGNRTRKKEIVSQSSDTLATNISTITN
ncbi:probable G-protein coupled receptor B0563.6 [Haliotis rufescens]|uniref:probable G-protein coupled receptor B0563.6 n=1 Tax=Haliotis rufescens TaxID=6454 RepID=UPI001EAFF594|nr:probable G-protein coupled receptor B0563.6 [Haliotis rufescens]